MNGTAATVLVAMAALLGVRAPAPASAQLAPRTRRSLISSGTRESLTPTITLSTPEPALGRLSFTISPGTTSCGGPGLNPPPAAPFSGRVDNLDGSERADLGLGCLYFGGGSATTFPPSSIPDGGTSVLAVTGISGLALALGPDPGSGPADCTLGAGPARHCLNGAPGTDGTGACSADSQCVGGTPIGACDLDANCFFGPPVPVPGPIASLSVCIMNGIGVGVAGTADAGSTTVSTTLSSRVYITGNATSPCPQCVSGACTYGERARMACSGGVGSRNTTIECPPAATGFSGRLAVALAPITTGTSTASDPAGNFCPGQTHPGAFGGEAGRITETGLPLGSDLSNPFATTLARTFCIPATGNAVVDGISDLPAPGAVSVPGTTSLVLPPLF